MAVPENRDHLHVGPVPLEADSWDIEIDGEASNKPYRGVRRSTSRRPMLAFGVAIGVFVLGAVAALWAVVTTAEPDAALPAGAAGTGGPTGSSTNGGSSQLPVSSAAPESDRPTRTGTSLPEPVAPFETRVYEAEAGPPTIKLRGAKVETRADASGSAVVRFDGESSQLQIRGVMIPADGSYRVTIFYVAAEAAHTALVSVNQGSSTTITLAAGSGCCPGAFVDVDIATGTHTITISAGGGRLPDIDRIVISEP